MSSYINSKPSSWGKKTSGHRCHSPVYVGAISWTLIIVMLSIASGAGSAEEDSRVVFGGAGATEARPLAMEWLNYWGDQYPFDNDRGARLVSELVTSGTTDSDPWAQGTKEEIREAIKTDSLLRQNVWNTIRCSRNECIAAIDFSDGVSKDRIDMLRSRLFFLRVTATH